MRGKIFIIIGVLLLMLNFGNNGYSQTNKKGSQKTVQKQKEDMAKMIQDMNNSERKYYEEQLKNLSREERAELNKIKEILAKDKKNPKNHMKLIYFYNKIRNAGMYKAALEDLIRNVPDYPDGYSYMAMKLMGEIKYNEAFAYAEAAIKAYERADIKKYPEITPAIKENGIANLYIIEILMYSESSMEQEAINLYLQKKDIIKKHKSGEDILKRLREENEELKSKNPKQYNINKENLK